MPSYELALVLKKMAKPETAAALKRAATLLYNNQGLLFNIENLGTRATPFKARHHGSSHKEASYFLFKLDSSTACLRELNEEFQRDVDILRWCFTKTQPQPQIECTLEDEMKPPAYRPEVQKMMETGKKQERKFNFNTGLDYNPFRT